MVFVCEYREAVTGLDALISIAVWMAVQHLLEQLEDEASDSTSDEWGEKVPRPQM